jgi:hypothetical protein
MDRITRIGTFALAMASLGACAATASKSAPAGVSATASTMQAATSGAQDAAALSGTWHGTISDPQGGEHDIQLTLAVNDSALTGTLAGGPPNGSPQPIRNGKAERNKLAFQISFKSPDDEDIVILFEGTVYGNRIRGVHGTRGMPMDFTWEATKQ